MNDARREGLIRRILVALDASPHSLAALRAAAELAADLDAELLGLYVEDIHLLHLAELPFAGEVGIYSAQTRPLNQEQVRRMLRSQARQAQRAIETLGRANRLRWNFRVEQGVISIKLLEATQKTDLIILGKTGWWRRRRLGSTARVIVQQAQLPALVLQQGARLGLPVGVFYDGSEIAQKALAMAANLLLDKDEMPVVVIRATNVEEARRLQDQARQLLRALGLQARYRWLVGPDGERLINLFESEYCGLLVVPAESELFDQEDLTEFLNRVDCPVLVVH